MATIRVRIRGYICTSRGGLATNNPSIECLTLSVRWHHTVSRDANARSIYSIIARALTQRGASPRLGQLGWGNGMWQCVSVPVDSWSDSCWITVIACLWSLTSSWLHNLLRTAYSSAIIRGTPSLVGRILYTSSRRHNSSWWKLGLGAGTLCTDMRASQWLCHNASDAGHEERRTLYERVDPVREPVSNWRNYSSLFMLTSPPEDYSGRIAFAPRRVLRLSNRAKAPSVTRPVWSVWKERLTYDYDQYNNMKNYNGWLQGKTKETSQRCKIYSLITKL